MQLTSNAKQSRGLARLPALDQQPETPEPPPWPFHLQSTDQSKQQTTPSAEQLASRRVNHQYLEALSKHCSILKETGQNKLLTFSKRAESDIEAKHALEAKEKRRRDSLEHLVCPINIPTRFFRHNFQTQANCFAIDLQDLASLMAQSLVGHPSVDPETGRMRRQPRITSDFVAQVSNLNKKRCFSKPYYAIVICEDKL